MEIYKLAHQTLLYFCFAMLKTARLSCPARMITHVKHVHNTYLCNYLSRNNLLQVEPLCTTLAICLNVQQSNVLHTEKCITDRTYIAIALQSGYTKRFIQHSKLNERSSNVQPPTAITSSTFILIKHFYGIIINYPQVLFIMFCFSNEGEAFFQD